MKERERKKKKLKETNKQLKFVCSGRGRGGLLQVGQYLGEKETGCLSSKDRSHVYKLEKADTK